MARQKREKTATESLLQIALGMEIALVFFGALVLNGLRLYPGVFIAIGALATTVVLVVLYRLVRYPAGRIAGHVLQLALLGSFFWDVVMGLSAVVMVGFWVFGAIRGPQLDRGSSG